MRRDCFGWEGQKVEEYGYTYYIKERCTALTTLNCKGCNFYKPRDSVIRHEYYIYQTKIVEWIPK